MDQDPALTGFASLGLSEATLMAVTAKGFEVPTKIQAEVIPRLLTGSGDIIAQSQTGTGKTAAFGLPLVDKLDPAKGPIQALIMVPTRELAVQVAEEINSLRGFKPLHVVPMYGGQSYELQFRHLRQGVDILVGTPGRLLDHLNRQNLNLSTVKWVVLDEADEMLDMGFIEDIETILAACSGRERTLLFSATMPAKIRAISKTYMREVQEVKIAAGALTANLTEQLYMEVFEQDKFEALCRIIDHAQDFYGMVFCRTKVESDNLYSRLLERGYDSEVLHGDVNQAGREKVLDAFRRRLIDILVATDVAARGIDVEALSHVINFSLPADPESYVHRIGRTGRAGREGTAITFVTPREFRKLAFIQKVSKTPIRRERLPRVDDIIEQKKRRILERMLADLDEGGPTTDSAGLPAVYGDMAAVLFARSRELGMSAEELLTRILSVELSEDLDASQYRAITEIEKTESKGGNKDWGPRSLDQTAEDAGPEVRLFVARGRMDGFTKPMIVDFIKEASGVPGRFINGVVLREKFSLVSVSPSDAERIVKAFAATKGKGAANRPAVRVFEEDDGAGSARASDSGPSGYPKPRGPKSTKPGGKPGKRGEGGPRQPRDRKGGGFRAK